MSTSRNKQRGNEIGPTGLEVGRNVKRVRTDLGWTQAELSDRLTENGHPIPVASVGRIESGDRRVEVDDLMALAVVLGVTPVSLLLPYTRSPNDVIQITGWGPESARAIWAYGIAAAPLAGDPDELRARSLPWWFEEESHG